MTAPVVGDAKVALREYLRSISAVTDVIPADRILLDYDQIRSHDRFVVLNRAAGPVNMYVPYRTPRIDITCIARTRWECVRSMHVVSEALGLHDPLQTIFIESSGVRITGIIPEIEPVEGTTEDLPNTEGAIPFLMRSVRLTVYHD